MDLQERIFILKTSGQIDEGIEEVIKQIIKMLNSEWNIKLTEENGAMLITHLCISLQRIKNKEDIEGAELCVMDEIKNNEHYGKALKILLRLEEIFKGKLPEGERCYILMHLCSLLTNYEGKGESI